MIVTSSTHSASDQNLLFQSFRTRDDSGVRAALNNVEWTPEVISEFQQSVLGSDVRSLCFTNIVRTTCTPLYN